MNLVPSSGLARSIRGKRFEDAEPVLCIIPPSLFLLDERVFLSLGMLRVAAALEAAGRRVEMLDLSGIENYEEVAWIAASRNASKSSGATCIVCITATTPQLPAAAKIAGALRSANPNVRIVAGGPHPTLVHSAVKLERKAGRIGRAHAALARLQELFDVIVSGDGEFAVFDAIADDAPPLIDADDPKSALFLTNRTYEDLPMPARHLVDVKSYRYSIDGFPATSLIAQLGCPFECWFCGGRNSKMLRKIRTRSTESVVSELEHLHRTYGFTGFMLYDDELNVNKNIVPLMRAIRALQDRLGVEFRLRGFVKSELFTDEQAEAMQAAGFRWVLCGFEAADPRILENINKKATREDNDRVIQTAHRHGLKVKALMSVGHPGESAASIKAVRDWLISRAPDDFDCTVISAYPGTPYYDEAIPHPELADVWTFTAKSGDRLHSYDVDYSSVADYYKGAPGGGYTSYVFTDYLDREAIVGLRDLVEKEVRAKLGIPYNAGAPGIRYEHSMGQAPLPGFILRGTAG